MLDLEQGRVAAQRVARGCAERGADLPDAPALTRSFDGHDLVCRARARGIRSTVRSTNMLPVVRSHSHKPRSDACERDLQALVAVACAASAVSRDVVDQREAALAQELRRRPHRRRAASRSGLRLRLPSRARRPAPVVLSDRGSLDSCAQGATSDAPLLLTDVGSGGDY